MSVGYIVLVVNLGGLCFIYFVLPSLIWTSSASQITYKLFVVCFVCCCIYLFYLFIYLFI